MASYEQSTVNCSDVFMSLSRVNVDLSSWAVGIMQCKALRQPCLSRVSILVHEVGNDVAEWHVLDEG